LTVMDCNTDYFSQGTSVRHF